MVEIEAAVQYETDGRRDTVKQDAAHIAIY